MAECKDCIHDKVCPIWDYYNDCFEERNADTCKNYLPTADVVEKSLFDELKCLIEKIDIKSDDYNAKYGADYAKEQVLTLISEFIKIKVDGRSDT